MGSRANFVILEKGQRELRYRHTAALGIDRLADNPRNPSNPPRKISFGLRSEDEMARLLLRIALDHPDDILKLHAAVRLFKRE